MYHDLYGELRAKDIGIAKNYLTGEELRILNGIVSGYFDFAEVQAMRHHPMHMSGYMDYLNRILSKTRKTIDPEVTSGYILLVENINRRKKL